MQPNRNQIDDPNASGPMGEGMPPNVLKVHIAELTTVEGWEKILAHKGLNVPGAAEDAMDIYYKKLAENIFAANPELAKILKEGKPVTRPTEPEVFLLGLDDPKEYPGEWLPFPKPKTYVQPGLIPIVIICMAFLIYTIWRAL